MENANHHIINDIVWNKERNPNYPKEVPADDQIVVDETESSLRTQKNGITKITKPSKLSHLVILLLGGIFVIFVVTTCTISAVHRIHEGNVGIYFKNGALLEATSGPGLHWAQPFVTSVVEVRVIPDTKVLDPMICTTRDGVRNVFRDVQIISSVKRDRVLHLVKEFSVDFKKILIYDRITEALQIFCANHTIDEVYATKFLKIHDFVNKSLTNNLENYAREDLKIWNVFLPKPDVPPAIASNYRQVKVEWTQQLVAREKQKTATILKNTEKIKAILDAETTKEVEKIKIAKKIQEEEGIRNITRIATQTWEERERSRADIESYVDESQAKSNQLLLTDQYIKLKLVTSLLNNTKMYFSGENSVVGSLLGKLLD